MECSGHAATMDSDVTSPRGGWTLACRYWPGIAAAVVSGLLIAAGLLFIVTPGGGSEQPATAAGANGVAASTTAVDPLTTASSWSMSPVPVAPAPAAAIVPAAAALAQQANVAHGVSISLDGQDWGSDAAAQTGNIGAVISAMDLLPVTVASSIATGPAGPLAVLSNTQGRTADGSQPYGNGARSFYTNSDVGDAGPLVVHEIVLATGAHRVTVAHELLHAYQFRNVAPGGYVQALLGDEMRSFIAATGWQQVASDEAVRAAEHAPWETIDMLYVYAGRELAYTDEHGATATLRPANPLEAFAMAGALYYARPDGTALPDWPEYWSWFETNLGPAR